MKTLKNGFLMPVAAIIFAIAASAFTATSSTEEVDYTGYLNTTSPCSQPIACAPSGIDLCEQGDQQAFGKYVLSQTSCPRVMYKP
ncbi:DUF6520 family protein [Flagellimonas sediminis]|uniref:Secreted protein n=1 Tax=Flagellimonas sediminis TaxID=2696468 RepID=A0A6I5KSY8_9FLAO|nr:DUF6520 family protein [Allomuricauda sediminis]NDV43095.1 hypothetical protein [Allomuricauda sediminis]